MRNITMDELKKMMKKGEAPEYVIYNSKKFQLCKNKKDYYCDSDIAELYGLEFDCDYLSTYYYGKNYLLECDDIPVLSLTIPEILDNKEKEYLSKVIEPFRNQVRFIVKCSWCCKEFIRIGYYQAEKFEHLDFPLFSPNTMYKGMRVNQEYTLEELRL